MKTAVITGSSRGIGEELAKELLKSGWKVYGLSRSKPGITHDKFIWLECDLMQTKTISSVLETIEDLVIDLLVSNAGVAFEELASYASEESYQRMFNVNVLAPMLIVNKLHDKLINSTIISISSVSDRLTDKDYALYCSSKAANTRYFESLARELMQATVVNFLPDYVDTPMLRSLQENREFDWAATLSIEEVATFTLRLINGEISVESGSNIIIANNALKEDFESVEKLYGYNADTNELLKL